MLGWQVGIVNRDLRKLKNTPMNWMESSIATLLLGTLLPVSALNVVFILADDLGYGETGCYGQKKILTPNIDQLAREGTRFTQHYTGAPVCAPARSILMTGKHAGHAEIRGNRQAKVAFPQYSEGQHPISEEVQTMAMVFRKAGYTTAAMGKWGLGPVGSSGDPNKKGFDLFFGYNCQAVAHSYFPKYLWRNAERIKINSKSIPGHAKTPEGAVTMDQWLGQKYSPNESTDLASKYPELIRKAAAVLKQEVSPNAIFPMKVPEA